MMSSNPTPLETALRRLLHDRGHDLRSAVRRRSAAPTAPTRLSSSVVARELDWFRRGQPLSYWHQDRRSD
jgi:hypothetical protein